MGDCTPHQSLSDTRIQSIWSFDYIEMTSAVTLIITTASIKHDTLAKKKAKHIPRRRGFSDFVSQHHVRAGHAIQTAPNETSVLLFILHSIRPIQLAIGCFWKGEKQGKA